jgi:hypothetical protein
MTDTGHLFKHPTRSGYLLACRCACGHVVLTPTTSPTEAAHQLFVTGWQWRDGYTCDMCVRRARETRLMGDRVEVTGR